MSRLPEATDNATERVLVCGVLLPNQALEFAGPLAEARSLVRAAGAVVVGQDEDLVQRRQRPDASTFLGKGKVEEVLEAIERHSPTAILVDNDLSPAQGRNLEKILCRRIIDRSELILDIFAVRANSRQARLQVELAQMEYMRPRLRRMWTHLERTEGAIGSRGPGETQLETDKRLIAIRIRDLKARLNEIEARKRRQVVTRSEVFTVGLVGYTNAGKSTLLNRVTGADVFVADMPFATLDTRTRRWDLGSGRRALLSDTVGFLQRLPHHLVASFHATLEEALNVDLLIHVVDGAHPDAVDQMAAVESTLAGLTSRKADLVVLNKMDSLEDSIVLQRLRYDARSALVNIRVPVIDGKSIALVRRAGQVDAESIEGDTHLVMRMRINEGALASLGKALATVAEFDVIEEPADPYYKDEDGA
jgi:GTP-binding protein HflX